MAFKMQGLECDGGTVTISVKRYETLRDMANKEKKWQVHPHGPFGVSYFCKDADFKKLLDESLENEKFLLKQELEMVKKDLKMYKYLYRSDSIFGKMRRLFNL